MALFVWLQNVTQVFNQFVCQFSSRLELRRDRVLTKDSMAQVNPVGLDAIGWKYYFVYVAVLITFFGLFWWMIRETRGLTTEEAAVVYEDDDVKEAAIAEEKRLHEEAILRDEQELGRNRSFHEDKLKEEDA